jgi:hypothetical protein
MLICGRHECQTTAGCAHRGPDGTLCVFPASPSQSYEKIPGWLHEVGALTQFTDEEIAREYHWRMMKKLGDPRVCVSAPVIKREDC